MHFNCVLDSVANILVRDMFFVGNVQKSPFKERKQYKTKRRQ